MNWAGRFPDGFDFDVFRARLKTAIRMMNLQWPQFCELAGVPPVAAKLAVNACEKDVRPQRQILEKLAAALNRDLRWLLTGFSQESRFSVSTRERTHALVEEFIYKADVPEEDHPRLHQLADLKIGMLQAHTPQAAFRVRLPQTWKDVAEMYDELLLMQG